MMSLRLELSRGALIQATTLKAFVRGPGVTGFPRWRIPSIVQGEVNLASKRRLDSEVYDEIVTALSSTPMHKALLPPVPTSGLIYYYSTTCSMSFNVDHSQHPRKFDIVVGYPTMCSMYLIPGMSFNCDHQYTASTVITHKQLQL